MLDTSLCSFNLTIDSDQTVGTFSYCKFTKCSCFAWSNWPMLKFKLLLKLLFMLQIKSLKLNIVFIFQLEQRKSNGIEYQGTF